MDDGDGIDGIAGLIMLAVGVALFICGGFIWVIWRYIDEHPEEAKRFAKRATVILTAPLWFPPVATARIVLFVGRDMPVYAWRFLGSIDPRDMVAFWVAVVPLALGIILGTATPILMMLTSHLFSGFLGWYALFFLLGVLGSYYYLYFLRPPHHPYWPIFIAAEEAILFDIRSTLALRRYDIRLWFLAHQLGIRHILKRG